MVFFLLAHLRTYIPTCYTLCPYTIYIKCLQPAVRLDYTYLHIWDVLIPYAYAFAYTQNRNRKLFSRATHTMDILPKN